MISSIYIKKAKDLILAIEENIGFMRFDDNTYLVKDLLGASSPNIDTFENVALAVSYILDERQKDAESLLLGIGKYMERDEQTGLIKNKINSENIFASDNLLLAVAYKLQGNHKEAEKQISNVESHIGFEERIGLLKNGIERNEIYPFNSLLLAISYCIVGRKLDAISIFNKVADHVVFNQEKKLMEGHIGRKNYKGKTSFFSFDNSLLAIYFALLGDYERSEKIILSIEKNIGFHPCGLVKRSENDDRLYTYVNSTLAIAYQSLNGSLEKMMRI